MKRKIIPLITALIVLGLAYAGLETLEERKQATQQMEEEAMTPDAIVFTGTLTEIDIGCYADGICKVLVDNKWVIFGQGWYRGPIGAFIGFDDIGTIVGKRVEVRAAKEESMEGDTENLYTILGDASLYIKLL